MTSETGDSTPTSSTVSPGTDVSDAVAETLAAALDAETLGELAAALDRDPRDVARSPWVDGALADHE